MSLARFERHVDVPDIGVAGQEKFMRSSALIVGLGGLGCPASLYLAAAGIGTLGLVDIDTVSLSNLQRQVLYTEADLGVLKTTAAAAALKKHHAACNINIHACRLDAQNANDLIAPYDIVLDCTDNFETRFLLNRICHAQKKKLVSAALYHHDGQVSVFKSFMGEGHPCYACIYTHAQDAQVPSCTEAGIVGPVAGVIGTMQANAAMNELLDIGDSLSGQMLMFSGRNFETHKIRFAKKKTCAVCA